MKKNILLEHLPPKVLERLRPNLKLVKMANKEIVHKPGEAIKFLYFPLTCMISITVAIDGKTIEAGAVGSREVAGINAFMGGRETTETEYIVQVPGEALKIAAAPLRAEFDNNLEVRSVLLKYTQAMIAHISRNVGCNRVHDLDQRCARWLLEVSDRMQSVEFSLTQEFISEMLGVTRSSVTRSTVKLKEKNIIEYSRSNIRILDLPALEAQSCECYFVLRDEYNRLLGPLKGVGPLSAKPTTVRSRPRPFVVSTRQSPIVKRKRPES
jgi:CRP-like cAMP-binding protein